MPTMSDDSLSNTYSNSLWLDTQDLSDSGRIEEALRRSEEQLRCFFDAGLIGMVISDAEGRLERFNDKFCEIVGYPRSKLKRIAWEQVTHPDDLDEQAKNLRRITTGAIDGFTSDKRLVRIDGQIAYVTISSKCVRKRDGKPDYFVNFMQDITQRKQAENALKASEERMRRFYDAGLVGMGFSSPGTGSPDFNDRFCEILGYSRNELMKLSWDQLTHPDDVADERKLMNQIMSGDLDGYVREKRCFRKDGQIVDVSVSVKCARNSDGSVDYIVSFVQDITARKEAEKALKRNEELLRSFYDAGLVGMGLTSPDKTQFQFNDTWSDMLGYSTEELEQMSWVDITHPDDIDTSLEKYNQVIAGKIDGYSLEKRCIRKDGRVIHVAMSLKAVRKTDGTVDYLVSFIEDITARKEAEDSLRRSEQQLREAQRIAHLGFWEWDIAADVMTWSEETNLILGYEGGVTHFDDYKNNTPMLFHPDDSQRIWDAIDATLNGNAPYKIEHRIVRPDGQVRHVQAQGEVTFNEQHKPIRMFGTIMDVTELKKAEEELAKHRDNLEGLVKERTAELEAAQQELIRKERLATLGQLTATVSHELRNPLGAIRPSLFILENKVSMDDPVVSESIRRIDRNIVRCDHIIDELLDFTRISNLAFQPGPFDQWLDQVLMEQAALSGMAIARKFNLTGVVINFDPDRLRRAIINVYDNACQAMLTEDNPEEFIPGASLTISTHMNGDRVEIVLDDSGPGISSEVLPRIFEPLYSTKSFGIGLGLPTVKQIMSQHGGGIEIEPRKGGGTRTVLWLPCSLAENQAKSS
jgi:PAS domain S-box-containing protein